jgi:hypothetical protein
VTTSKGEGHPHDSDEDSDADDVPIESIRIKVFEADGKYRGTFYRDSLRNPNRWIGATKNGVSEIMVCDGPQTTGQWFLIEYVVPRQISGDKKHDSLLDEASRCCCRTPVQALHWFNQQAIGIPHPLVERVRTFRADWMVFCASSSARATLQGLVGQFVDDDHAMFAGQGRDDLALLRRLNLLAVASGSPPSYCAGSIVQDMGVDDYIHWTDGHLARVASVLADTPPAKPLLVEAMPAPAATGVLKFERPWDAKRKCLEALDHAPDGIPRHEEVAVTTKLELQTVKEVMLKLKKARHVAKKSGAWRITAAGRKYLTLLRGA